MKHWPLWLVVWVLATGCIDVAEEIEPNDDAPGSYIQWPACSANQYDSAQPVWVVGELTDGDPRDNFAVEALGEACSGSFQGKSHTLTLRAISDGVTVWTTYRGENEFFEGNVEGDFVLKPRETLFIRVEPIGAPTAYRFRLDPIE